MNEVQTALNEIMLAAQAAAGRYRDAGDLAADTTWRRWFARTAERRDAMVRQLQEELRRQGELPHDREEEAETFRSLATRMRTAVASDQQAELLEVCRQSEEAIAEAVKSARQYSLSEPVATLLARLADEVRQALSRLQTSPPTG